MVQTEHQKKIKRRNDRIIADFERIMREEEGATAWKVANHLSARYKITPNMIVRIVKNEQITMGTKRDKNL